MGLAKYLVIGSFEAYSGKSAITLGIAHQLKQKGLDIAYGKPLGGDSLDPKRDARDADVEFIAQTLELDQSRIQPALLKLDNATLDRYLANPDTTDYQAQLKQNVQSQAGDRVILEGPGGMNQGRLFGLSLPQIAEAVDGAVLLVAKHRSTLLDRLLAAKQQLGDRLVGVVINDVPQDRFAAINTELREFLEQRGIAVLGVLPHSSLLQSVSVDEIVRLLNAEVLCQSARTDAMVESLVIGAMNVNSALKYFRQRHNMAVVTGGDRTDLQLAALETSTQCLILTGHLAPSKEILARAEEMEIALLSVDLDTLTTVEIVDRAFGRVRLNEPIKVECICQMAAEHLDSDRLLELWQA
ncbi:phosphotransacetylase family protein [Romeriopsis navalis]|nr:phosphotransacetylase family protein [Romeriopsis navalis]